MLSQSMLERHLPSHDTVVNSEVTTDCSSLLNVVESTHLDNNSRNLNFTVVDDSYEIPAIVDLNRKRKAKSNSSVRVKKYRLY